MDLTKGKGVPTYLWYKKGEVKDAITDIQIISDKAKVPGKCNHHATGSSSHFAFDCFVIEVRFPIRIPSDGFELLDRDLQKGLDSTLFLCFRKDPKLSKPISDLRLHDHSAADADFGPDFAEHDQSLSNLARVLVHIKRSCSVEKADAKTDKANGMHSWRPIVLISPTCKLN